MSAICGWTFSFSHVEASVMEVYLSTEKTPTKQKKSS